MRQKFDQFQYATDPRQVDVMLLKSRQDYQETMNCWKQTDHVLGILLEQPDRKPRTFLQKFYEGALFWCFGRARVAWRRFGRLRTDLRL